MTSAPTLPPPRAVTPVPVPRRAAIEFLVAQAALSGRVQGLKLARNPVTRPRVGTPSVLCSCDHGPGTCVTEVPLKNIRLRIEGWLLADLYAGQCPYCNRVYWG